jgi:hypothetical protein
MSASTTSTKQLTGCAVIVGELDGPDLTGGAYETLQGKELKAFRLTATVDGVNVLFAGEDALEAYCRAGETLQVTGIFEGEGDHRVLLAAKVSYEGDSPTGEEQGS